MNIRNKIASILLLIPFLFSTIGLVIYNHDCSCSGKTMVSLYFAPDSCGDNDMSSASSCCSKENHSTEEHHSSCNSDDHCDCPDYDVQYLKINNEDVNDPIQIENIRVIHLFNVIALVFGINDDNINDDDTSDFYIDPPNTANSTDFLVEINQLKIPLLA